MSASRPPVCAAALVLLAAACGPSREQRAAAAQQEQVEELGKQAARLAAGDSSPVGRATISNRVGLPQVAGVPGDSVRITSTDGAVIYTLARDTVRMQLGDSLIRHVRQEVSAADSTGGNFVGLIRSTVAGAVGSAMRFVMKTPVRDIKSARYDDGGELRIESRGGPLHHGTFSVGDRHGNDHTTFARADAERFIAAVEARQRALGVR